MGEGGEVGSIQGGVEGGFLIPMGGRRGDGNSGGNGIAALSVEGGGAYLRVNFSMLRVP